jgi:hypothetical protein
MKIKSTIKQSPLFLISVLCMACAGSPASAPTPAIAPGETPAESKAPDELDAAVRETSDYLNSKLARGATVVFLNFKSDYPDLSEYLINELIENTVNDGRFAAVDRQNLAFIQQEIDYQLSGEVSDETAQSIGKKLGAQVIILGSIASLGDVYLLTVRAIGVESAEILGMLNRDIPPSDRITELTRNRGAPSVSVVPGGSGAMPESPAQPVQAEQMFALPSNVTEAYRSTPAQPEATGIQPGPTTPVYIGDFSVGSWFSFYNVTGANNDDLRVDIEPYLTFSRAFNDNFNLNVTVGNFSGINTGDTAEYYKDRDISPIRDFLYLGITPSFSFRAGPGTLGLSLQLMPVFYLTNNYDFFYEYRDDDIGPTFIFNPAIWYGGDTDFGYLFIRVNTDNMGIAEGADYDKNTQEYKYGLWIEDLYLRVGVNNLLDTNIRLWLTSYFFIDTNDYQIDSYFRKLCFGLAYDGIERFSFGLDVDVPIGTEVNRSTMEYQGIRLKPYVGATFGAINVWANLYIYHIGANTDHNEVTIMPEIGVSYSF